MSWRRDQYYNTAYTHSSIPLQFTVIYHEALEVEKNRRRPFPPLPSATESIDSHLALQLLQLLLDF